jgi:Tol biopolymer transport system component
VADLEKDRSERLLPGFVVSGYDTSSDGKSVLFSATDAQERSRLWVASLDLRFSPREFPSSLDEDQPHWDAAGHIYFRAAEGKSNFLYRMNADGSERVKLLPNPILSFGAVSPDGRWVVAVQATGAARARGEDPLIRTLAFPASGGPSVTISPGYRLPMWNAAGNIFSISPDQLTGGKTLQVAVSADKYLPALPPDGIVTEANMAEVKGAKVLDGTVIAGPTPGLSATLHQNVHRNLYRIPLQ